MNNNNPAGEIPEHLMAQFAQTFMRLCQNAQIIVSVTVHTNYTLNAPVENFEVRKEEHYG
jgi:hypothetical protein